MMSLTIIAIGAAVLLYAWLAYGLILAGLSRRVAGRAPRIPDRLPAINVLLAAHNEAAHIRPRLENLLSLDHLANGMQLHIGLDGCTDRTADIAREFAAAHSGIDVHEFAERRGKVAVLKDLVAASPADILVFTDANTMFRPDAVSRLVAYFSDPGVGGVCGRLLLCDSSGPSSPESAYWRWETALKERESALDSCLGANGAIYAIRRHLFWKGIPDNTLIDDFVIGMKVREQGYRMVYAPEAIADEQLPDPADEWRRRVRIGAGGYQALALCRRCLSPHYGRFAWMFWSHKVLRWLTPHLMILLLALALLRQGYGGPAVDQHQIAELANHLIIAAAVLGLVSVPIARLLRRLGKANSVIARPLLLIDHFLGMQAALFVGFLRYCRGGLKGHWTRTPRQEMSAGE